MSRPLYVPILPTRRQTGWSYRDLPPDLQRVTAPLWTLTPRADPNPAERDKKLCKDLQAAASAHRYGTPAWLDAPYLEEAGPSVAAKVTRLWRESALRPVTGTDSTRRQRDNALVAAQASGQGLGIRVRLPGSWNERVAQDARALIATVERSGPLDLLLDLGAVLDDRPDAGRDAVLALDALVPLADWRHVVSCAGSLPGATRELRELGNCVVERHDWELWHTIRHSRRPYATHVRYGDYGALQARLVDVAPPTRWGPAWGTLRYTADRTFLLARVHTRKPGNRESVRAAARWLVAEESFRGEGYGPGEYWLWQRAREVASDPGNAEAWSRQANDQHLAFVARQLQRLR